MREKAARIKLWKCGCLSSLIRAFPGRDYGITASDDKGIGEGVSQAGQRREAGEGKELGGKGDRNGQKTNGQ